MACFKVFRKCHLYVEKGKALIQYGNKRKRQQVVIDLRAACLYKCDDDSSLFEVSVEPYIN